MRKRLRDDVYAVEAGTILWALTNKSSYGNRIYMRHADGTKAMYAHLEEIYVANNEEVQEGQLIGKIGNSGYSLNDSGKHLHVSYFSKYAKGYSSKDTCDPTFWIMFHTYPTNTKITNPYKSNMYNRTVKNKDGSQKLKYHEGEDFSYKYTLENYENGIVALDRDYLLVEDYPQYYGEEE